MESFLESSNQGIGDRNMGDLLGIKKQSQSDINVSFEFDEVFGGQEIQLAEIDLNVIEQQEKQQVKEDKLYKSER